MGILKAMHDEMDKDLGGAVSAEEEAAKGFAQLSDAKKAEIEAAGAVARAPASENALPWPVQVRREGNAAHYAFR